MVSVGCPGIEGFDAQCTCTCTCTIYFNETYIVWAASAVFVIIGTLLSIAFWGALVVFHEREAAIHNGALWKAVPSVKQTILRVTADVTVPVLVDFAAGLLPTTLNPGVRFGDESAIVTTIV